jgi:hypothetical protein
MQHGHFVGKVWGGSRGFADFAVVPARLAKLPACPTLEIFQNAANGKALSAGERVG